MQSFIDIISGYKKVKLFYYVKSHLQLIIPNWYLNKYKSFLTNYFKSEEELANISKRVSYYNQISKGDKLGKKALMIQNLSRKESRSTYFYDSMEYLRYFNQHLKINTLFGDITHTPNFPTLVKSRPITENKNSILLKLDKQRHFLFLKDRINFSKKKKQLIGRGMVNNQKHLRVSFLESHFNNPLCDVGHTNKFRDNKWKVDFVSIREQLQYKFILCWEGNDVATNLKYVMSSNSLAVTTKPKYETWFMEGSLIGGVHYVEIKNDFSDLDEKLIYYSEHIDEAEKIIKNANEYTKQFQNKKREDLISIKVLEKYFQNSNQL